MIDDSRSKFEIRAYEIWEREGHPHGRAVEHWFQAIAEITQEEADAADAKLKKATARKAAAKSKPTGSSKRGTSASTAKKNPALQAKKPPSLKKGDAAK